MQRLWTAAVVNLKRLFRLCQMRNQDLRKLLADLNRRNCEPQLLEAAAETLELPKRPLIFGLPQQKNQRQSVISTGSAPAGHDAIGEPSLLTCNTPVIRGFSEHF